MGLKMENPPIFVLGAQRSGTTLLVSILSKNDSISFFPQETHIYPLFWQPRNRFKYQDNNELAQFILTAYPKVNNGWTLDENREYLQKFSNSIKGSSVSIESANDLLEYTFNYHMEQEGDSNKIYGEKTPSHIYYYKEIIKKYPEAKFVIAIRDPRASALSEKIKLNNNERIQRNFKMLNFASRWRTANNLALQMEKNLGDKKVHIVKYEQLILSPKDTIKSLCNFMNVPFGSEMLKMQVVNSSFKDDLQKGKSFNPENLNRWKTHLSVTEIETIETYLQENMRRLDYSFYNDQPTKPIPFKNKLKINVAEKLTSTFPASFHHYVRHEKYKSISGS